MKRKVTIVVAGFLAIVGAWVLGSLQGVEALTVRLEDKGPSIMISVLPGNAGLAIRVNHRWPEVTSPVVLYDYGFRCGLDRVAVLDKNGVELTSITPSAGPSGWATWVSRHLEIREELSRRAVLPN